LEQKDDNLTSQYSDHVFQKISIKLKSNEPHYTRATISSKQRSHMLSGGKKKSRKMTKVKRTHTKRRRAVKSSRTR
jgi:hypothetical protein